MKRLLAVDTSTWWGSVALVECDAQGKPQVVAEWGERVADSHVERLLQWITALLAEAGWAKGSIDAYAATRGPGSFTGIRVALGTVRGLSLATDRPALGVTTLAAIAEASGPADHDRVAVMEAGRGELYSARYDPCSSPPSVLEKPRLGAASEVLARAADDGVTIPGPGTVVEPRAGTARGRLRAAPERLAGAAGRIAAWRGATADPLAPLYIRPPDALLKRTRG